MNAPARDSHILRILHEQGQVSVEALSHMLGVSQMTIRRDLRDLEEMGMVSRTRGGAGLKQERGDVEWPVALRLGHAVDAKRRIGRVAAKLVREGDVVILDAGTTVLEVARHLTQNRLTVATNFLPALDFLANRRNINLIAIGGTLQDNNLSFVGPLARQAIGAFNANVAIIGTSGLSLAKGTTNRDLAEAEVKRAMMAAAEKVVLVMDSSKMHRHTLASVARLEEIDVLVTDTGLADDDRRAIVARGVEVLLA